MRNLLLIIGIVTIKGLSSAWAGIVTINDKVINGKVINVTYGDTIDAWPKPPKGNARVLR